METKVQGLEPQALPRRGLRERHFRKFEKILASAARTSRMVMDPAPRKAWTFMTGLSDARTGFCRYGYESKVIPKDYNLYNIKLQEMDDGTVLLLNSEPIKESETQ